MIYTQIVQQTDNIIGGMDIHLKFRLQLTSRSLHLINLKKSQLDCYILFIWKNRNDHSISWPAIFPGELDLKKQKVLFSHDHSFRCNVVIS